MAKAITDLYDLDDSGRLNVHLHAGQAAAWECVARFILLLAGTQGGKTSFGPLWLWRATAQRGEGDFIAASPTHDLLQLKLLPELKRLFCATGWRYRKGDKIFEKHSANPRVRADSRVILRSVAADGSLESTTAQDALLDEFGMSCVPVEAWEAIQRRLSISQGRALITTTPYNMGWLKQQVYDRAIGGDPDYAVVNFKSSDNPSFPRDEYERAKRTLPAWKFDMFYNGIFTKPSGLIYPDYNEALHCVEPFTIPSHWLRYVGVDFGAVHTAIIWIAEEPIHGDLFVYRESLSGGKTQREHAEDCLDYDEPVQMWRGGAKSEGSHRDEWRAVGIPIQCSSVDGVEAQIDRVSGLLKCGRLHIFSTCAGIRSEISSYSRELDAAGEPTERIADKARFHRLDALRYIASELPYEYVSRLTTQRRDYTQTPPDRSGTFY